MNRLLVPGGEASQQAANLIPLGLGGGSTPVTVLQDEQSPANPFETSLGDFAANHDLPTAEFATKRLEYREAPLHLVGQRWPIHVFLVLLFVGCIALGCMAWVVGWFRQPYSITTWAVHQELRS
jgi:hypothetical protein